MSSSVKWGCHAVPVLKEGPEGVGEAEGRGELATPTAPRQGLHPGQPHQEEADTPLSITFQI